MERGAHWGLGDRPANDQVYQLVDGNCRFWAIYQLFNLIDRPIDSHENDFWDVSETLNEALETDTKLCEMERENKIINSFL